MRAHIQRHLARYAVACFVVFLWSAPHLASTLEESNRRHAMWERADAWWQFAPVLVYGMPGVLLAMFIDWSARPGLKRGLHALFVMALGGGILTNLDHHLAKLRPYPIALLDVATHFGWLVLAALAAYVVMRERSRVIAAARRLCLVGSPTLLLIAYQMAAGPNYPRRMDPLPNLPTVASADTVRVIPAAQSAGPDSPSIYWFIFDEWSYERSYHEGRLDAQFKNLQQFSQQAVVFHKAESPASYTEFSMPRMLFKTKLAPDHSQGELRFCDGNDLIPSDRFESVLALPGQRGYFRVLIGFAQPYSQWIGRDLDLCRSHCFYPYNRNVRDSLASHAVLTAQFASDPMLRYLYARWANTTPYAGHYRQLHAALYADVAWVLTHGPRKTFAIMHYCLPHKPFLFNADGTQRPTEKAMIENSVEGYERSLGALDVRIGEFIEMLRRNGRFDDSLVIITSDHSWRADPLRRTGEHPVTHVPLIVKLPHASAGAEIKQRFEMYRMGDLIAEVLGAPVPADYRPVLPVELKRESGLAARPGPAPAPAG